MHAWLRPFTPEHAQVDARSVHNFPAPTHEGSTSLWHLADVLAWLQTRGSYSIGHEILELARVARAMLFIELALAQRRAGGTSIANSASPSG
ncbi:hypothetical protein D3C81_666850 [compost metagenome]